MAESKRPDAKGISYFDITDFSAGIVDAGTIVAGVPSTPAVSPGVFPAPPGAADGNFTFGCMSGPTGGLEPMPALTGVATLNSFGISSATTTDISSLINSYQNVDDELIIGLTTVSGSTQFTAFWSSIVQTFVTNAIVNGTYNYTGNAKNFVCYPFTTVINNSGTIQPVVVLPVTAPDGPTSNLYVYPSVTAPTAYGVDTIATTAGTSIGHQGRILAIQRNAYGWPGGTSIYPNEAFNYTDPPETETYPHQFEIFGPENPVGYGALNSVSAGELFAVKCRGGAIIIQGDLNNPTVTTLPGVQSTGSIYGRSGVGQGGMYYCCDGNGAWVWNGGNTSQKVSTQLDDHFFNCENPITNTTNYSYYVQQWGDWVLFSNNWVLDTKTGNWWRLYNPATASLFWYVPGFFAEKMFAAVPTVPNSAADFLYEFDRSVPSASFTWQSLPIKLPSEDHTSTVRELVIRASNPYGDAAPQIIASLVDDKGNSTTLPTWTMTGGINTVQEFRVNSAVKQTTTIAVNLAVSGTSFAPVVHGLSMGSRTREHLGAN